MSVHQSCIPSSNNTLYSSLFPFLLCCSTLTAGCQLLLDYPGLSLAVTSSEHAGPERTMPLGLLVAGDLLPPL